jgi:anti-sigma B factor antagonist
LDLKISGKQIDSIPILILDGEIDVYTAPRVKSSLVELVNEGKYKIIVDLNGIDFMDSSGLGVLVGGLKRVKPHQGVISIVCSKEKILKIFKITGLTKVFPIFDSQEEALKNIA